MPVRQAFSGEGLLFDTIMFVFCRCFCFSQDEVGFTSLVSVRESVQGAVASLTGAGPTT